MLRTFQAKLSLEGGWVYLEGRGDLVCKLIMGRIGVTIWGPLYGSLQVGV